MKLYCYINRHGDFRTSDLYPYVIDNNPDEGIDIGEIEGKDLLEIEEKAKQILRERFQKLMEKK